MRDRAPVNTKALRTVAILHPDMLDVGCISHFLDRVGTNCKTPILKQFMTCWNCIFTTSIRGRVVWKEIAGPCQGIMPPDGRATGNALKSFSKNGPASRPFFRATKGDHIMLRPHCHPPYVKTTLLMMWTGSEMAVPERRHGHPVTER